MTQCSIRSEEHTDLLLGYCARKLDEKTAKTLELHMEGCAVCAAFRDSQRAVWKALDAWQTPSVSADFNRRLYARIESAAAAPWYSRWLDVIRPVFAQPAFPLSAAALVIVAGFILDHPAAVTPLAKNAPAGITRVSATEAEQVEKTLDDLEMLRQFDVNSDKAAEEKENSSKSM